MLHQFRDKRKGVFHVLIESADRHSQVKQKADTKGNNEILACGSESPGKARYWSVNGGSAVTLNRTTNNAIARAITLGQ